MKAKTDWEKECERLQVQLAGCGVAALGYTKHGLRAKKRSFGWSASYADVLKLRLAFDKISNGRSPDEILRGPRRGKEKPDES
jgi:hypothetical protein